MSGTASSEPARLSRLLGLAITVLSGLAMAATREQSGAGGCCTVIVVLLFVAIYRSGGTDWARSFAAAMFPGIFGWFIWRDRALGGGARWVALIFASLQVFSVLLSLVAAIALPGLLARAAATALPAQAKSSNVDLSQVPEDPALGLHPPATITTVPAGALVFVNGKERGRTPLETPLTAGERNEVRVELAGYFPEMQAQTPNAREHLVFSFTLKEAARLKLSTTPPGARVLVGMEEVLARTPGLAQTLEPGETELLVLLDGYQPLRHALRLPAGETSLELTLTPGVKISVGSTPAQADVFVDGAWLGRSPLDVFVSAKGKHTIELKKAPWAPASKTFTAVKKPTSFRPKLVDLERVAAQQAVVKARARYDKVNDALEKLQTKIEHMQNVPAKVEQQRVSLDRDMEKAASALEAAEWKLKELEESRGMPPVAPPEDANDDDAL